MVDSVDSLQWTPREDERVGRSVDSTMDVGYGAIGQTDGYGSERARGNTPTIQCKNKPPSPSLSDGIAPTVQCKNNRTGPSLSNQTSRTLQSKNKPSLALPRPTLNGTPTRDSSGLPACRTRGPVLQSILGARCSPLPSYRHSPHFHMQRAPFIQRPPIQLHNQLEASR